MIIRAGTVEDAPAIARFIAMAEAEMVPLLTGFDDAEKAGEKLAAWVASPTPNRYSYHNNLVVEADGKPVASLISFAADAQRELDALLLEDLNRRGVKLDKLFFEGAPGTYYLSTMGVDPEYRGRGYGSSLMAAAGEKARKLGFARLSLLVSKDKPRARALYERLGFAVSDEARVGESEYYRMIRDL